MVINIFPLLKYGAGASLLVTPIAYIAGSSSAWETKWFQRISYPNLVLDCRVLGTSGGGTNANTERYEIFLTVKKSRAGLSGEGVTFQILKSVGNQTSWGTKEDVSEKLGAWRLRLGSTQEIDFQHPASGTTFSESNYKTAKCTNTKNVLSSLTNKGAETTISGKDIKFTLPERNTCKKTSFVNVECDININSNHNLKWNEGFKPKVIFSPL